VPDRSLEDLAIAAMAGDASALEAVLAGVRDDVYGLALRMLWHPEDAADATQDVLIKVMTRLGDYRGEAALRTWMFRIAANHLRTVRRGRMERTAVPFDAFAADLRDGLADPPERGDVDLDLLETEVKLGCTNAMLLCLDRDHRLAFVLGTVFGLSSVDAAAICEIDPATYRKRLSRARARIRRFLDNNCGLVNPSTACSCARRIRPAISRGRIDPRRLLFASTTKPAVTQMEHLHAAAAVFRSHPRYAAPQRVVDAVRAVLASGRYPLITGTAPIIRTTSCTAR
jgi:RNA polymerase sigma factor (sigma-70 family)